MMNPMPSPISRNDCTRRRTQCALVNVVSRARTCEQASDSSLREYNIMLQCHDIHDSFIIHSCGQHDNDILIMTLFVGIVVLPLK